MNESATGVVQLMPLIFMHGLVVGLFAAAIGIPMVLIISGLGLSISNSLVAMGLIIVVSIFTVPFSIIRSRKMGLSFKILESG